MKGKLKKITMATILIMLMGYLWADNSNADANDTQVKLRLAMSKNDKLCHYVQKNYKKYILVGDEEINNGGIFKGIKWEAVDSPSSLSGFKYTKMDIDNDGTLEFVFANIEYKQGITLQSLSIYDVKSIHLNELFPKDGIRTKGFIQTSAQYELKEFNEKPNPNSPDARVSEFYVSNSNFIEPFLYQKTTYLFFQGYIDSQWQNKKWSLVAKYHGGDTGMMQTNKEQGVIEDMCYFEMIKL